MAHAGPEALASLQEVIRQLRTTPQVRERAPGSFHLLGRPFVQIHDDAGRLSAELQKTSGAGMDRLALDAAPDRRKFVDEAKRRAAKLTDE